LKTTQECSCTIALEMKIPIAEAWSQLPIESKNIHLTRISAGISVQELQEMGVEQESISFIKLGYEPIIQEASILMKG